MWRSRPVLFVLCILMASCAASPNAGDPAPGVPADVKLLREQLESFRGNFRCGNGYEEDMRRACAFEEGFCECTLGEKRTFAACEGLLTNSASDEELADVLMLLSRRKGDRARFIPHALQATKHADPSVRESAVTLLGKIATPNELPALRAMLTDPENSVVCSVAEALAALGGPDELIALDQWMSGPGKKLEDYDFFRRATVVEVVERYRVALKVRLVNNRQWPPEETK